MDEGEAPRDVFPHDRVVFFSDAVFAIAITLLAIELHLPGSELIERIGKDEAWRETNSLFIAFVISFMVLAVFWRGHMQTWKHVSRATGALVWCSLLQLMFVTLMPFATSVYASGGGPGSFAFYSFVLACISLFAWLTRRVAMKQENLRERLGPAGAKWFLARSVVPLAVFTAGIPLAWALPPRYGAFVFLLIFPLLRIVRRWCFRPAKQEPAA